MKQVSHHPCSQFPPILQRLSVWLAQYAPPTGLIGYHTSSQILEHAVAPACALSRLLGNAPIGTWADIGAGSGALGLAIALLNPGCSVTLVDRRRTATHFADIAARRLRIPNARAITAELPDSRLFHRFSGVCFRAMTDSRTALAIAGGLSSRWICAWHAPGLDAYDAPPGDYAIAARTGELAANLAATLYVRQASPVRGAIQ